MKILAINGSHRKGMNVSKMLNAALEEAKKQGASTELVEITDYEIKPCISCNKCLFKPECKIDNDDMKELYDKLQEADGIIIGSPVYFSNVTGRLKTFMDRTRPLHMTKNYLEDKVGAGVVHAGLRNGGQELTLELIQHFLIGHGLLVVGDRKGKQPIISLGAMGTMCEDFDGKKLEFKQSVEEDDLAMESSRRVGKNVAELIKKLSN
ncbi:flavodoxin family protein [Natranaerofaba carboxydovora]|uniref:flavodoxin family protein n=1 Tax=Natranaerofaba carboxydovora TaxID=2742683 RepID=UPI001F143830|nr:flavodoxin family protein [Natranaerofaba carboxydovora]UMZ73862.1 2-amino-4-deoxychorismate dehydrogenase [Natranaerofaba carboxydovora]